MAGSTSLPQRPGPLRELPGTPARGQGALPGLETTSRTQNRHRQKFNFNENCIDPVVDDRRRDPPGGRGIEVLVREAKPGWLNRLNASHRNSMFVRRRS